MCDPDYCEQCMEIDGEDDTLLMEILFAAELQEFRKSQDGRKKEEPARRV